MVSKQEQTTYEAVLERDRWMTFSQALELTGEKPTLRGFIAWTSIDPWICVAQLLGASDLCSGEMTRDHVHEHAGGTKAKRAPTTMETVVILCRHHHLDGWATSHRPEIREYIKEANERYRSYQDSGSA